MAKEVKYPDDGVCYILSTYADHATAHGTGVLITTDEVLTAAHMLADDPTHGKVTSVAVAPALNGTEQPFGAVSAVDWHAMPIHIGSGGTITEMDMAQDFGLIHLAHPPADFDMFMNIDTGFAGGTARLIGYPAVLGGQTQISRDVTISPDLQVPHLWDEPGAANHGDSGGPLFWYDSAHNWAYVVGVQSAGSEANGIPLAGYAPRFTNDDVYQLNQWIAEGHPGDPHHLVAQNATQTLWHFV